MTRTEQEAYVKRLGERDALHSEVIRLFYLLDDDVLNALFDVDSMKLLRKKKRVLQALLDGKSPEEIGNDYYAILEKLGDDPTVVGAELVKRPED